MKKAATMRHEASELLQRTLKPADCAEMVFGRTSDWLGYEHPDGPDIRPAEERLFWYAVFFPSDMAQPDIAELRGNKADAVEAHAWAVEMNGEHLTDAQCADIVGVDRKSWARWMNAKQPALPRTIAVLFIVDRSLHEAAREGDGDTGRLLAEVKRRTGQGDGNV